MKPRPASWCGAHFQSPNMREAWQTVTNSAEETLSLGHDLARQFRPPCLVLLEGELGSGKTTLTKGIVAGLGAAREEEVSSPSFTLVHEYGTHNPVYHIDLYRIDTSQDLATLGLDDLFRNRAIVVVEWGEKFREIFPEPDFHIKLEHLGGDVRRVTVEALNHSIA